MTQYPFRLPVKGMPLMTFEVLAARLNKVCDHYRNPRCTSCTDKIGTTVTLRWHTPTRSALQVRLYDTTIAILTGSGAVKFPNDDPHMTTTEWISRIIADNGLGSGAGRIRRHKADGPGPEGPHGQAGLLCIDGNRENPVHDRLWQVPAKYLIPAWIAYAGCDLDQVPGDNGLREVVRQHRAQEAREAAAS